MKNYFKKRKEDTYHTGVSWEDWRKYCCYARQIGGPYALPICEEEQEYWECNVHGRIDTYVIASPTKGKRWQPSKKYHTRNARYPRLPFDYYAAWRNQAEIRWAHPSRPSFKNNFQGGSSTECSVF